MNKNPSMKQLLTEWRKVIVETNERDLTEDEKSELQYQLGFLGSTAFYSEPDVYITPQGDVAVEGIQIGFVDDLDFDGGMGESYPSFGEPPAFMENNEDEIGGWMEDLWESEFELIDYELTAYDYTPDLGNGFAEFSLVISAEIIAESE